MSNLLKIGAEYLAGELAAHAAETVTYTRSVAAPPEEPLPDLTADIPAVVGRSEFDIQQSDGLLLHTNTVDFIIRVEDLVLDETATEPVHGDRITYDGEVYELMPIAGENGWRYTDEHRYAYRIHTKHVDTA
jgi:hypothetical protein